MRLRHDLHEPCAGAVEVDEHLAPDRLALGRVLMLVGDQLAKDTHLLDLKLDDADLKRALYAALARLETYNAVARDRVCS